MKDLRSILRLTYEQGLSVRAISERLQLSKTSVATYLLRAREVGLICPLPPIYADEAALQRALFERHRIEIPVTVHAGRQFLRISIQAYNGPEDLEALLAAYRKLMSAADEVMM